MGQLIASKIFGGIRGLFSALDTTDETLLKDCIIREKVEAHITDGGTAGTAQTETFAWKNTTGTNQRVTGASICTPVAVTADAANKATVTVTKRDAAGINPAVVATLTTDLAQGNLVAFLPAALTPTVANVIVPPNGVLTVLMSKAGTGVAMAAATAQARVEIGLEPVD